MQTAANINLVLTDSSSFKRFADSQRQISYRGFYQQVASELVKGVHSKEVWRELGERLLVLAEHAHACRKLDALEQVSQILMNSPLPRQYQAVGRYYQALCMHKFGRGDVYQAARRLERMVGDVAPRYTARAMLSLGSMFVRMGDNQSALSLYCEASRFVSRSSLYDPYGTIHAQKMFAVMKSDDGNHRGALALLENLLPLAHSMRSSLPHVYYDYLNSLAVELCEVGRLEEAKNVSQIVLASPFAGAYPEWRETSNEIALRGRRPSRATVAFSQRASEAKNRQPIRPQRSADDLAASSGIPEAKNLVRLLVPERGDSLAEPPASEPAAVLDMQEWKKKMTKRSNGDPQEKIPRPTTEKEKQARLMELRKLGTRERLVGLMTLIGDEKITDDELLRALIILEGIEPVENQGS